MQRMRHRRNTAATTSTPRSWTRVGHRDASPRVPPVLPSAMTCGDASTCGLERLPEPEAQVRVLPGGPRRMPVRKPDDPYDARMSAPEGRPAVHDHGPLDLADLDPDPIVQVRAWLVAAEAAGVVLADAMALATVGSDGAPSVRHVLLRDVTDTGITFFTNRTSRKARELGANPRAASTLYWRELDRQVCLRGPVTEVSAEDS